MRKFSLILFLILGLACNKDDDPEKYTSINGAWVVRTPDDATTVVFNVAVDSDNNPVVQSASVTENGSPLTSQPIDAAIIVISPQEVESVTLRADVFVIRLLDISVNNDFTEMEITNSIFLINGAFREFSGIKATRN